MGCTLVYTYGKGALYLVICHTSITSVSSNVLLHEICFACISYAAHTIIDVLIGVLNVRDHENRSGGQKVTKASSEKLKEL